MPLAMMRAVMSDAPPGLNGTTMVTSRCGKLPCARAGVAPPANRANAETAADNMLSFFISSLLG